MQDLIIFGAGGFGRETALMVQQINDLRQQWNLLGFYDDAISKGTVVDGVPVLGGVNDLLRYNKAVSVVIAIADPAIRKKISIALKDFNFPVLIHPSVLVGDLTRNKIGKGSILAAGTILTTGVSIGDFVIINLLCTIGHDVTIGNFSSIMPGCSLSGSVSLGAEVLVGSGARILPGLQVGERSKVGAGAVVTRSVNSGVTVIGIPAREKSSKT
jgi:sugar O-acyltransferase (sialic acid O-acetyltransferase NeuD family)